MPAPQVLSVGRIPIVGVGPVLEEGRWPARAVVGEAVPITATLFREGHDAEGANVVITRPSGRSQTAVMQLMTAKSDRRRALVTTAERVRGGAGGRALPRRRGADART